MAQHLIGSLHAFLRTAQLPTLPEPEPTYFSIAGIEHRELPLSNTYAFFFRSEERHGLGTLFRDALLDVLYQKEPPSLPRPQLLGPARVAREHPMNKGQWLDLLVHDGSSDSSIHGATYALLIENKVNHWLANDLHNYWESVRGVEFKAGIVLGPRTEAPAKPWVYISHAELGRAVELRLGPSLGRVHPRYLPILLQFLEHLKQMSDASLDAFTIAFDYTQRHRALLAQAQQLINSITPAGVATAVAEAFGPSYMQASVFDNRVDIRHVARTGLRYIVFFGDILNLGKKPGFAITFYAGGAHKREVAAWRKYLTSLPETRAAGIDYLPWFMYNELVVGKSYDFLGQTLSELKDEVADALRRDWQPLEPSWLPLNAPPVLPD